MTDQQIDRLVKALTLVKEAVDRNSVMREDALCRLIDAVTEGLDKVGTDMDYLAWAIKRSYPLTTTPSGLSDTPDV